MTNRCLNCKAKPICKYFDQNNAELMKSCSYFISESELGHIIDLTGYDGNHTDFVVAYT